MERALSVAGDADRRTPVAAVAARSSVRKGLDVTDMVPPSDAGSRVKTAIPMLEVTRIFTDVKPSACIFSEFR